MRTGCCATKYKLDDVSVNPVCDGSEVGPSDPAACCPVAKFLPVSVCANGERKCASVTVGELKFLPESLNWYRSHGCNCQLLINRLKQKSNPKTIGIFGIKLVCGSYNFFNCERISFNKLMPDSRITQT